MTPDGRFDPSSYHPRPFFDERRRLWLYGNAALLGAELACMDPSCLAGGMTDDGLRAVDAAAADLILDGKVLVCGVHHEGHRRAAVAPLRWGSPRIVVFSGGFLCHLGESLKDEPFREARLWRYEWDPRCDLAVSLRAPNKAPRFAEDDPTVDRLIVRLAGQERARSLPEPGDPSVPHWPVAGRGVVRG